MVHALAGSKKEQTTAGGGRRNTGAFDSADRRERRCCAWGHKSAVVCEPAKIGCGLHAQAGGEVDQLPRIRLSDKEPVE
ncbi:MAG: hypothetical protein KJO07_18540, partial [Deltaproteobacteria bacterium]|nr:hypothetical protein [Deltaproteobacteria bacterium]